VLPVPAEDDRPDRIPRNPVGVREAPKRCPAVIDGAVTADLEDLCLGEFYLIAPSGLALVHILATTEVPEVCPFGKRVLSGIVPYIDYFECSVGFDCDVELSFSWTHCESVWIFAGLDRFSHVVLRTVDDGHAVAVRVGDLHKISLGIDGHRPRAVRENQEPQRPPLASRRLMPTAKSA
jgi:hypothetical protein